MKILESGSLLNLLFSVSSPFFTYLPPTFRAVVVWSGKGFLQTKFLTLEPFFFFFSLFKEFFIPLNAWISEAQQKKSSKEGKALNKQNYKILIKGVEGVLIKENSELIKLYLEYILDIAWEPNVSLNLGDQV